MVDSIADILTRIRNAQAVGHPTVSIPFSKVKFSLAKVLAKEGFAESVSKEKRGIKKAMEIKLKYQDDKNTLPKIRKIKQVSKPGKREYIQAKNIYPVLGGTGINIISTSRGLMTGKEAKKKGLGGEILCEIW